MDSTASDVEATVIQLIGPEKWKALPEMDQIRYANVYTRYKYCSEIGEMLFCSILSYCIITTNPLPNAYVVPSRYVGISLPLPDFLQEKPEENLDFKKPKPPTSKSSSFYLKPDRPKRSVVKVVDYTEHETPDDCFVCKYIPILISL